MQEENEMISEPLIPDNVTPEQMAVIRQLRPMDDEMMRVMFRGDLELAQFVFPILVGKEDLLITSCVTQADLKQISGSRSIVLDVYATDSTGRKYDLELQRARKGAEPHRARYHNSVLDVENLKQGQYFSELPETYVIFLTEMDYYGKNSPVYEIERWNKTTDTPFEDGSHILYINGAYRGDDLLGKLMHDFNCTTANDMKCDIMRQKARYYKETKRGTEEMNEALEAYAEKRAAERATRIAVETAQSLLKKQLGTYEDVAEISKLPIEQVREIARQLAV